jgi:hypothetical protein
MQKFFLSQPRSSAVRAAFLCPVAVCSVLTARAVTFCDRSLLQKLCRPRNKENIFLSLPRRSVRAAGRAEIIFLSQPSKRVRTPCRFFFATTMLKCREHRNFLLCSFFGRCAANFLLLSGRIRAAVCSCRNFFCAVFSFVVRSHLRRTFLTFVVFWNLLL